jgi:hypothetical protein
VAVKPRRTPETDFVFRLPGGTEDNDLWVERAEDGEQRPLFVSFWQLNDAEREAIAAGGMVELMVWGTGHQPVALSVGPSLELRKAGAEEVK